MGEAGTSKASETGGEQTRGLNRGGRWGGGKYRKVQQKVGSFGCRPGVLL